MLIRFGYFLMYIFQKLFLRISLKAQCSFLVFSEQNRYPVFLLSVKLADNKPADNKIFFKIFANMNIFRT